MRLNAQRIFVGNLPTEVTENDILKRFSSYGKIQSTEIKRRSDGSVFAYVNLEADRSHINECLEHMSKRKWHGCHVKVELAKERFLDRLAKERQEQQSAVKTTQMLVEVNPTGTFMKNGSQDDEFVPAYNLKIENQGNAKDSHISKFETEDSGSDTCGMSYSRRLPMFRGTLTSFVKSSCKVEETPEQPSPLKEAPESTQKRRKKKVNVECDLFHASEKNLEYQKPKLNNYNYEHKKQKLQNDQTILTVVKNKTHFPAIKSLKSEEKRLKSIEEKRMSFKNQLQTVKRALAAVDALPNTKIIFSDNETSDVYVDEENDDSEKLTAKASMLFNDESSDDETNDFKIKSQFEGRKGQKLLELQSRYANDKRFTLDERFYESDDNEAPVDPDKVVEFEDEKNRQLNILLDVLGDRAHVLPEKREKPSNGRNMLRFDPLKADHKRFEVTAVTIPEETENESKKNIVENGLKMQDEEDNEAVDEKPAKVEVSKEKFYKVTDRLKETLKSKTQNDTQFSLLEMFGSTEDDKDGQSLQGKYENSELNRKKQIGWSRNPFKYDSSDSEEEYQVKKSTQPEQRNSEHFSENMKVASSFFFKANDARLKEGIEFITSAKRIGEEEFSKRRRELKLIIRAKVKNNLRKKRPWKKKLGGQKKKTYREKK